MANVKECMAYVIRMPVKQTEEITFEKHLFQMQLYNEKYFNVNLLQNAGSCRIFSMYVFQLLLFYCKIPQNKKEKVKMDEKPGSHNSFKHVEIKHQAEIVYLHRDFYVDFRTH